MNNEIVRRNPWSNVPTNLREIRRQNTYYYLLSIWLRNHPPTKKHFTLNQLSEEFSVSVGYIRSIVNDYRLDGKMFLRFLPKPSGTPQAQWNYAIGQLHRDGFYFVNPIQYLTSSWGEPSFRQYEDYINRYFGEAVQRAINRLDDALEFSMAIDGIDIRKELGEQLTKKALVQSCSDCKHSHRCIGGGGFKCPWGKTYSDSEINDARPEGLTQEDLDKLIDEYQQTRWGRF
jgi:hypothetical protein